MISFRTPLGVLLLWMGMASAAPAQETRATVTGTVKDAQGAHIPGVTSCR